MTPVDWIRKAFSTSRMQHSTPTTGTHSLVTLEDQLRVNQEQPQDYSSQVEALSDMFEGMATYGNQQTKNIIKVRAAFTVGPGVKGKSDNKGQKDFIDKFLAHNDLDKNGALPQGLAAEAEIEGKVLIRLVPNREAGMIELRYIPWTQHGYVVETDERDYHTYNRVTYNINKSGGEVRLQPEEFVFVPFGGRVHKVNETPPVLGSIIREIQGLDKALRDWRRINWIHASPTPWFKCENRTAVDTINSIISGSGSAAKWKIGQALATAGVEDFRLVSADMAGTESIEREIKTAASVVSGASGVPVHFLGLPDVLNNAAIGEGLMELVTVSTSSDRRKWVNFYTELMRKALMMAKTRLPGFSGLSSETEGIHAEIPYVTSAKLQEIVEVWLPLYNNSAITLETLLTKIPDIEDEKEEADLIREREETMTPRPPSIFGQKNNTPGEAQEAGEVGGKIAQGKLPPQEQ